MSINWQRLFWETAASSPQHAIAEATSAPCPVHSSTASILGWGAWLFARGAPLLYEALPPTNVQLQGRATNCITKPFVWLFSF